MIDDKQLAEWERLCGEASPEPWHAVDPKAVNVEDDELCPHARGDYEDADNMVYPTHEEIRWTVGYREHASGWNTDGGYPGYGICEHDARFIAASRTALPALIAEVRRLRARWVVARLVWPSGEEETLPASVPAWGEEFVTVRYPKNEAHRYTFAADGPPVDGVQVYRLVGQERL